MQGVSHSLAKCVRQIDTANTSKFLAWPEWRALVFTAAAAADQTEKIKLKWKAFN